MSIGGVLWRRVPSGKVEKEVDVLKNPSGDGSYQLERQISSGITTFVGTRAIALIYSTSSFQKVWTTATLIIALRICIMFAHNTCIPK